MEEISRSAGPGRRRSSVRLLTCFGVIGGDMVGREARDDEQANIIGVTGRVSICISLSTSLSSDRLPLIYTQCHAVNIHQQLQAMH